jgi:hypothetical protein
MTATKISFAKAFIRQRTVEIVAPDGVVHYRRPEKHSLVAETKERILAGAIFYSIRYADTGEVIAAPSLATPVKLPPTQTNPSPCGFCCGTKFIEYEACPYCFGIREVPTL